MAKRVNDQLRARDIDVKNGIKNKWNSSWLDEKFQLQWKTAKEEKTVTVTVRDCVYKTEEPGVAQCEKCKAQGVITYGEKGKSAIFTIAINILKDVSNVS